jgi:hypothetical protein
MICQQNHINWGIPHVKADVEVSMNGKETSYQADAQGFNDEQRLITTLDYLHPQRV